MRSKGFKIGETDVTLFYEFSISQPNHVVFKFPDNTSQVFGVSFATEFISCLTNAYIKGLALDDVNEVIAICENDAKRAKSYKEGKMRSKIEGGWKPPVRQFISIDEINFILKHQYLTESEDVEYPNK